ncbi:MAG: hypothetical protein AB8C02_12320 [Halioglobus sp.]
MDRLKKTLLEEIEQRWAEQFTALARGEDVSPGARLRTEGLMEAAVMVLEVSQEQLITDMDTAYNAAFGNSIAQDYGDNWRELFPFPQIPAMMRRAPVVPTTKD